MLESEIKPGLFNEKILGETHSPSSVRILGHRETLYSYTKLQCDKT